MAIITKKRATVGVGLAAGVAALSAALISNWEGEDLVAKHHAFDPAGVITVCRGSTNHDWPWLKAGMKFTKAQCEAALVDAIPRYAAPLQKCVANFNTMPPHRQAALISASYNLGPATVCKSTAVRLINAGQVQEGCNALGRFVMANGKHLRGLWNRRHDKVWGEITWCLRED